MRDNAEVSQIETQAFGAIELTQVPLPDGIYDIQGTYTWSGKVLLSYRRNQDPDEKDWYNVATVNDDGSDFQTIFSGMISELPTANGIRWMPFKDNKRVLLGDYVLECTPDIDGCESSTLVPLRYPDWLMNAKNPWCHWSEIIIAPDNKHISWTTLGTKYQGVFIGELERGDDEYSLGSVQYVSPQDGPMEDVDNPGCVIPVLHKGGEVKQFVHGGAAISQAGAGYGIAGPVVQWLTKDQVDRIAYSPGYDETLMFSPDEKLGVMMSPMCSPDTNFAIAGLLPRPYMRLDGLAMPVYLYAVADVRKSKAGNVGPILVDIKEATHEKSYSRVDFHDTSEEWVYYSPISWHPDSNRVMWNERKRLEPMDGSRGEVPQPCRLRIARLKDQPVTKPLKDMDFPANVPYGIAPESVQEPMGTGEGNIRIAGRHSGYIEKSVAIDKYKTTVTKYLDFSDDGKTFWHGHERMTAPHDHIGRTVFEGKVSAIGETPGEMDLRLTFVVNSLQEGVVLSNEIHEDGRPETYGYARYEGTELTIKGYELDPFKD